MKEKIEHFSKGDFEYELPLICLSDEEIRIKVEAGKKKEGSFTVSASTGRIISGTVYSTNRFMKVDNPQFHGVENIIHYYFDAAFLKEGERFDGELCIISDCGEALVPFLAEVENSYFMTSLGKIKDLFQFTNLARADWSEAKKIFRSEDFERVFLSNEERYRTVYRGLMGSISTSQALEEFLITIHKKSAIRLEVDKTEIEYQISQEQISDKIVLTKNNWGFAEIRVSADAPFIVLEQKFVWADRFIGNTHQIAYTIDPVHLKYGINYGNILIKTAYQTLKVQVVCRYRKENRKVSDRRRWQKLELGLVDNYLSFRLNRIKVTEYLAEAEAMVGRLPGPEVNHRKELMRIHMAIVSGRRKLAEELLVDLSAVDGVLKKKDGFEYCCYLYLEALYKREDALTQVAARTIRSFYEGSRSDWRLLWLLLYLDKKYEKNRGDKLQDIREQFKLGCRSPILYYEAVCIVNEDAYLLRELNDFEIQVLNFGIKNWILSKEAAQQYVYLAGKRKTFHPVIYSGLCKLYDEYGTTEILSVICSMLIKGMQRSEKYFPWYRLGVEAHLRITELYEYYMYSVPDKAEITLAQPVLLYFIYNSSLSDRKKAFLYASVIRSKDKFESIYRSYYKRMEIFAEKMLEGHYISRNLALLYKEFFNKSTLSDEVLKNLPYIMFRNELECGNPNMVSVIVVHKETGEEETAALVQGRAQIDMYTNNLEVLLVDNLGNRYAQSVDYTLTPYLNPEDYENRCSEQSDHPMLLLHLFDRYESYRIVSDKAIALRKKVLGTPGLTPRYGALCRQTLIEYYYENYDDELLEQYLEKLDLSQVAPAERTKYIEIMVIRALYDQALEALETYGVEGISINRLVKLCSGWMLREEAAIKKDIMVSLCHYVFTNKKYDEAILSYLVEFYEGPTREMFSLWKAAKQFDLDTHRLEERLLVQMLFTESHVEESFMVFHGYYRDITNHTLVRAFLSYYAYKYLVHNYAVDQELLPIMKRELYYDENDICLLAWLKYNADNNRLTEQDLIFAEYNIARLVRKGIVLPLFLEYGNRVALPERLTDKCFITYYSDPKKQIYIHYRLEKDQEYITERMPNMILGIHSKEMVLFYHEELEYYISEESSEATDLTESFHIRYEREEMPKGIHFQQEDEASNYGRINRMLRARELGDDDTLLELMGHYIKQELMIEACFYPIE
ncbi:MAG TPA: hypothetical protein GXX75_17520 [Clostridiales bacterium]|nr:hypothetical protein [Clostridiales bacterium]